MIPQSLKLHNFTSYGTDTPALDFNQFHTACITGANGHGKSSILDAITWAVWGEARHTTKSLVRLGETDMRVEFVFDHEGDRYCILRRCKLSPSGTPTPTLELQVWDDAMQSFKTLSRGAVRDTQAQISKLVRMDYDTFVASAYLKQGEAAAFTKAAPGRRKEILGEILGLAHYQAIAECGRVESRTKQAEAESILRRIDAADEFLALRPDAQHVYDHYNGVIERAKPAIDAAQGSLDEENARRAELMAKRPRAAAVATELTEAQRRHAEHMTTGERFHARQVEVDEWRRRGAQIEADFNDFNAAKQILDRWDDVAGQFQTLDSKRVVLRDRISMTNASLQNQRGQLEGQLAQQHSALRNGEAALANSAAIADGVEQLVKARTDEAAWAAKRADHDRRTATVDAADRELRKIRDAEQLSLSTSRQELARETVSAARLDSTKSCIVECETQLQQMADCAREIQQWQEERAGRNESIATLKAEKEAAEKSIAAADAKLAVIESNPDSACPLCASQLGEQGRSHLIENIRTEIAEAQQTINSNTEAALGLQQKKKELDTKIVTTQTRLKQGPAIESDLASARHTLQLAEASALAVAELTTSIADIETRLADGTYAPTEIARLRDAEAERDAVGYNAELHAAASQALASLAHFEKDAAGLDYARSQVSTATTAITELEVQIEEVTAKIESSEAKAADSAELAEIDRQIESLGYSEDSRAEHSVARSSFTRLQNAAIDYNRWQTIMAGAPAVGEDILRHGQVAADLQAQADALSAERASLANLSQEISTCEDTIANLQQRLAEMRRSEREALDAVIKHKHILDECSIRAEERAKLERQRVTTERESFLAGQVGVAFGKDGIPALIIENAIPELVDEANSLLERMSTSNMRVSINSLRDKMDGGIKETLDIVITDDQGTREYLMYSGGEAFRVDFALRVALSKLLARRAGAPLRTLIIDEGFGTQDAAGLQQMIECIQAIADDFSKVLVVTHLDVIKNAFPTRIEVVKTDAGSSYQVLQG